MKDMKRVGFLVSVLTCLTLSICLPFVGVIQSGSFRVGMYLLNFTLSFAISFIISLVFPAIKVNMYLEKRFRLKIGSLKARLVETLVSDLIYTPVISIIMTTLAWYGMKSSGEQIPPYIGMILVSLLISFAAAYVIIFITVPLYLKLAMKIMDIPAPGRSPDERDKK